MKRLLLAAGLSLSLAACAPAGSKAQSAPEAAANAGFLAQNAKAPGVVTLPSGLQYKIVHSGPAVLRQEPAVASCIQIGQAPLVGAHALADDENRHEIDCADDHEGFQRPIGRRCDSRRIVGQFAEAQRRNERRCFRELDDLGEENRKYAA